MESKSPKKRLFRLRNVTVGLFMIWASYTYLFIQRPQLEHLKAERNMLHQQVGSLQQQQGQLEKRVQDLQTDDYIARLARKYYNMMKQGEVIYKPESSNP